MAKLTSLTNEEVRSIKNLPGWLRSEPEFGKLRKGEAEISLTEDTIVTNQVIGIDGPMFDPDDDSEYGLEVKLKGKVIEDNQLAAVTVGPAKNISDCRTSGAMHVRIQMLNENHRFARTEAATSDFISCAYGPFEVLWTETFASTPTTVEAVVMLGGWQMPILCETVDDENIKYVNATGNMPFPDPDPA